MCEKSFWFDFLRLQAVSMMRKSCKASKNSCSTSICAIFKWLWCNPEIPAWLVSIDWLINWLNLGWVKCIFYMMQNIFLSCRLPSKPELQDRADIWIMTCSDKAEQRDAAEPMHSSWPPLGQGEPPLCDSTHPESSKKKTNPSICFPICKWQHAASEQLIWIADSDEV